MPPVQDPATGKFVKTETEVEKPAEVEQKKVESKVSKEVTDDSPLGRFFNEFTAPNKKHDGTPDEKKPDKEVEKKPPTDKEATPKKEKKAETPPVKPAPKKTVAATPVLDTKAIADAAAQAVIAAQEKSNNKREEKASDPDLNLSPAEKRRVEVLRHMETLHGDKYKGTLDKYRTNLKKLSDYKNQWEKLNPGQTFDPTSNEHTDFYDKNDLYEPWDEDDFDEARISFVASKTKTPREEALQQEINELKKFRAENENEKKIVSEAAVVNSNRVLAASTFWNELGDSYTEVVKADGSVDSDKLLQLKSSDPYLYKEIEKQWDELDALVEQAHLIKKGAIQWNPEAPSNADEKQKLRASLHRQLADFVVKQEQQLTNSPPEAQINQHGQRFLPNYLYIKLPQEQLSQYWTFNSTDIAFRLGRHKSAQLRKLITEEDEKFTARAAARGIKLETVTQDGGTQKEPSDEQKPDNENEKPHSPSSTASPKVAASSNGNNSSKETGVDAWMKNF